MNRSLRCVSVCLVFVSAAIIAGCAGTSKVTLSFPSGTAAAIDLGQSYTINVTSTNDSGLGVSWSCTGTACSATALTNVTITSVTFNANGVTGTATITATSNKDKTVTRTVTITVNALPGVVSPTQAQLTATAGNPYSFTFTATGGSGTLTWSATGLPAWLSISSAGVLSGTPPASGTFNFTVTVTDSSAAGGKSTVSGQLTFTVNPAPVLSITKTHTGSFTQGQQGATYTVTVSNAPAAGPTIGTTVTVTETAPSGLTLVSMAGTGWTCATGGTTCTRSDVLAAGASYPAITVTVNVAANASSPQVNAVSVSGGGSASANASDSTTIVEPVLTIVKTHTGSFNVGQQGATYTVTVGNNGSAPTSGTVTVTETVPSGETLVSMAGTGWTCASGGTTCTRGDALANGSSYPAITVTVNVSATATSPQVNKVSVSGGGSVSANTSDSTTILFPVLSITKTHAGSFNVGQQNATYTVTVGNTGTGAAAPTVGTVTVTDTVPSGETLVSMAGTGWTCGSPANACTRSDALAVGSSYPAITVTVNVSATASSPQINSVSVSGGGATATASANDSTTIAYPALTITKTHTGNFTQGQQGATYTVTVGNNGSAPTVGTVTVTDTVPSGETLVSMAGTGWTCGSPANACTRSDALANGSSYPAITVTVNVSATAPTPQVNQVSASGGGATATASASDSTTIVEPVLTITKTHSGNFTQGQNGATYTVTVSNSATATAPTSGTVTVTDTVPSGETLVSMAGTGWTCPSGGNTCTRSDALAVGASYPAITVTVNVSSTASSPQINQVSVSGGGSASANASDSTTIIEPVLAITKTHSGNFTQGQTNATYTVTVSNNGTAPTSGTVTVTDTVPSGETLVSMAGTNWTCPSGGNTCTRSDALATGSSYDTITVTVNVSGTATSPQINQVSVSGGGSVTANASDSTTINVLSVTIISGSFTTITAGASGVTLTAQVTNDIGSQGITWTLTAGGTACAPTCGSLSGATTTTVIYTPPTSVPSSPNNAPTITATSVADSSKSASFNFTITSSTACGTGSEGLLTGQYTAVLQGHDSSGPVGIGLMFDADGKGGVAKGGVGIEDINSTSASGVQQNLSIDSTKSSYSVGSDHRGCLTIVTPSGTQQFRFSLGSISGSPAVASNGHIIEFNPSGSPNVAELSAGVLRKQDTTAFNSGSFSGFSFAFGASAPEVGGGKFGVAGVFSTSGTTITTGSIDVNDAGTLDGDTSLTNFTSTSAIAITGSYTIGSNGRGTFTFSNLSPPLNGILYVVSASELLSLRSDAQTTNTRLFAGKVLQQSKSSFSASDVSGTYVSYGSALAKSVSGGTRTTLLLVTTTSTSTFNGTQDQNDGGTLSSASGSGTYSVASDGRALLNITGSNHNSVLYLVSPTELFSLDASDRVGTGFAELQSGSPFSAASAKSPPSYAFGTIQPEVSGEDLNSGVANFDGVSAITGTVDENSSGTLSPGGSISFTYSIDSTGTGYIPQSGMTCATTTDFTNGNCRLLFMVISPPSSTSPFGKVALMDAQPISGSSNTEPSLYIGDQ